MNDASNRQQAVELLQELGLKEYEAKCFVALSRLTQGTAKDVSDVSEVPRTRVYDAIRVLESKGLVEVQHSSPKQFRSTSIEEAVETLRGEYESRMTELRNALDGVEPAAMEGETEATHEVWALSGSTAIANRTERLIGEADREVLLVVADESAISGELFERIESAEAGGVDVIVGTLTEGIRDRIHDAVPDANVFVSDLEWLQPLPDENGTAITRMLLVDRNTILVSTAAPHSDHAEQAIFGRGFTNGIVVIARRLMATGLVGSSDPTRPEN